MHSKATSQETDPEPETKKFGPLVATRNSTPVSLCAETIPQYLSPDQLDASMSKLEKIAQILTTIKSLRNELQLHRTFWPISIAISAISWFYTGMFFWFLHSSDGIPACLFLFNAFTQGSSVQGLFFSSREPVYFTSSLECILPDHYTSPPALKPTFILFRLFTNQNSYLLLFGTIFSRDDSTWGPVIILLCVRPWHPSLMPLPTHFFLLPAALFIRRLTKPFHLATFGCGTRGIVLALYGYWSVRDFLLITANL